MRKKELTNAMYHLLLGLSNSMFGRLFISSLLLSIDSSRCSGISVEYILLCFDVVDFFLLLSIIRSETKRYTANVVVVVVCLKISFLPLLWFFCCFIFSVVVVVMCNTIILWNTTALELITGFTQIFSDYTCTFCLFICWLNEINPHWIPPFD